MLAIILAAATSSSNNKLDSGAICFVMEGSQNSSRHSTERLTLFFLLPPTTNKGQRTKGSSISNTVEEMKRLETSA